MSNKPRLERVLPDCVSVGRVYKIADTTFVSSEGLYAVTFPDYTVLADFDCSRIVDAFADSLKAAIQEKWRYCMHVSHGMSPSVSRNLLYARVMGGELLGYKFMDCSMEGNETVYYGFVPTQNKYADIGGTHKKCRFAMQAVFPRRLYVYFERVGDCDCGRQRCVKLQALDMGGTQKGRFCAYNIPWTKIYIMLGELDETCTERLKVPRQCEVCAQCFECSKSVQYCRKHRICKHKQANVIAANEESGNPTKIPKIKNCKTVKSNNNVV